LNEIRKELMTHFGGVEEIHTSYGIFKGGN
jgi:hypothetical protein